MQSKILPNLNFISAEPQTENPTNHNLLSSFKPIVNFNNNDDDSNFDIPCKQSKFSTRPKSTSPILFSPFNEDTTKDFDNLPNLNFINVETQTDKLFSLNKMSFLINKKIQKNKKK